MVRSALGTGHQTTHCLDSDVHCVCICSSYVPISNTAKWIIAEKLNCEMAFIRFDYQVWR